MNLKEIMPGDINENTFNLVGKDWMLVTANNADTVNTMTASWGGLGVLWNKNVAFVFIRPSRYTYDLMECTNTFSLTFFDEQYRDALKYCGANSGRDKDKISEANLTPVSIDNTVIFEEAKISVICKKLYITDIDPAYFIDADIEKHYNGKDYHRMYIAEIEKVLVK